MSIRNRSFWTLLSFLCSFGIAVAQEAIENWPAPLVWSPPARSIDKGEVLPLDAEAVDAVPTPPLHFVGITPCRLVDTRGNGFTGAYGPPVLTQGVPRNFVLTGRCGINASAQAVSLNVTVTNTQGPGFILIYPQGSAQPTVSTLNYVAGQTVANAAVVPLGTGGAITVIAGVSGADLILDTNGDYRPGVVTTLNGLSGNVTLASETNVTVTPFGQTLFLSVNPDPGGVLPSGTENQTLRHNGKSWEASSVLTNSGIGLGITGFLNFPATIAIVSNGASFLHNSGGTADDTLLGLNSGGSGTANTGVGIPHSDLPPRAQTIRRSGKTRSGTSTPAAATSESASMLERTSRPEATTSTSEIRAPATSPVRSGSATRLCRTERSSRGSLEAFSSELRSSSRAEGGWAWRHPHGVSRKMSTTSEIEVTG